MIGVIWKFSFEIIYNFSIFRESSSLLSSLMSVVDLFFDLARLSEAKRPFAKIYGTYIWNKYINGIYFVFYLASSLE